LESKLIPLYLVLISFLLPVNKMVKVATLRDKYRLMKEGFNGRKSPERDNPATAFCLIFLPYDGAGQFQSVFKDNSLS